MTVKTRPVMKPLAAAVGQCFGWTTLALMPGLAWAGPLGESVQQGVVGVVRPDANTTEVTQSSANAVVNWHSFSVGGAEYVKFVQPGANAAILNRVVGGNSSQILGRIDANGRVFLVNPQGVYFGAGAKVDASAFAASTLDIADDDFMNGRYVFAKGTGATDAAVENHGEISADQFVVLMGDRVANEGLVQARLGTVALGAGEQVTLTLDEAGLVSFAVDEATASALAGVENTGEIVAQGGRVLMTAKVAEGLVATAVNNAGVVRAQGIDVADGGIYLRGSGGNVVNSGTLDASGEQGGTIRVTSTQDVEITSDATVSATGVEQGGDVRLVAQQNLRVASGALVDTRSETPGTGGTIELSAHEGTLKVDGDIRTGDGGELIIDPARVRIDAGAGGIGSDGGVTTIRESFIESQLNYGGFTLVASDEIFSSATQASPITINSTAPNNLLLRIGSLDGSSFFADSNGAINLQHVNFNLGGAFVAEAGTNTGNIALGNVTARNQIRIEGGNTLGNVTVGALNVTSLLGQASVEVFAGSSAGVQGIVTINGPISATTNVANADARVRVDGRVLTINGNTTVTAGGLNGSAEFDVIARNGISINGSVTLSGNDGENSLDIFNSAAGNIFVAGALRALNGSYASIDVRNDAGNVTINGLVEASGDSAEIFISGNKITLGAGARATANTSYGSASIDFNARRGVDITGDLVVTAGAHGDAEIDIDNSSYGSGSGEILIRGAMRATGGSSASIDVNNYHGGVTVNGLVAAQQNNAANTSGSAGVFIYGETGVTLNGAVTVNALGSSASAEIYTPGALALNAPFDVSAPNGGAYLFLQGASVTVRNAVSATGADSAMVYAYAGNGPLQTLDNGIFTAPELYLTAGGAGSFINVRTNASEIGVSNYGSGAIDVALDNTANAGPTSILANSNFGGGSYGSSFGGASLVSSQSVYGGLGALKARFTGDVQVSGPWFARNAIIEVTNGSLHFNDTVYIGDLNLPPTEGDALSILALSNARRPDGTAPGLPLFNGVPTTGANAIFEARNGISFSSGLGFQDPDTPYVVFRTDGVLDLGDGVFSEYSSGGGDFLAQFTSYTPGATIHVENAMPLVPLSGGPTFTNLEHFSKLPGTTMIIGNAPVGGDILPTGNVFIGNNGQLNIGNQNILFVAAGTITGIGNVLSTGFIGELDLIADDIGGFEIPVINDILTQLVDNRQRDQDDDDNDEYVDVDGEGDSGSDQLISQQSDNGQMCQ